MHYDITCMHSSGYTAFFMSHTILQILRVLMVFKIIILWLHSTLWTDNLLRHIPIAAPAAGLILFFAIPEVLKQTALCITCFSTFQLFSEDEFLELRLLEPRVETFKRSVMPITLLWILGEAGPFFLCLFTSTFHIKCQFKSLFNLSVGSWCFYQFE